MGYFSHTFWICLSTSFTFYSIMTKVDELKANIPSKDANEVKNKTQKAFFIFCDKRLPIYREHLSITELLIPVFFLIINFRGKQIKPE